MSLPGDQEKRKRVDPGRLGSEGDSAFVPEWPGKRAMTVARRAQGDRSVGLGAVDALERASASAGAALPDPLRGRLETALGADLGEVRVHTGAPSAEAAVAVGASAYAVGQDVHFGPGTYAPGSREGDALIAHEVAHAVQQRGLGTGVRQDRLEVSEPGDAHELEAEAFARSFVDGGTAPVAAVRAGTVARAVIHRSPPEGGGTLPKTEAQFNRAGVEAVRGQASAMMIKVAMFQADAVAALAQLKSKILGFADNYKLAYKTFSDILVLARQRARNQQEMIELAEEVGLGILIAVTGGAALEVAIGAEAIEGVAARVAFGAAKGMAEHAATQGAMSKLGPHTGGVELEANAVDPQTVDMKSYQKLSEFATAVGKVDPAASSVANLNAAAEYCIGEIKAQMGDGSASEMTESEVFDMAQSIVACGPLLSNAQGAVDRAEAKLAGVKAVVGSTPEQDAVAIEKQLWTKWMTEQKPEERVVDLDPIENHLRLLGLVGWKLLWYSESDEAHDIDNAKDRSGQQDKDNMALQTKQRQAEANAEGEAQKKQQQPPGQQPADPNAPATASADTSGTHTAEEFNMAQVEVVRGNAAATMAQFAIAAATGGKVQSGMGEAFRKYWVAYKEAYGNYGRVVARGKQAARDSNALSKQVSGYVFAGVAGGIAGGVEAGHHAAGHAHQAGSAVSKWAGKIGHAAAEKGPEGVATAGTARAAEQEGGDLKPTAISPDGIDAAMFKHFLELQEALADVSSSKLDVGLLQGAAEYCLGEIKGHISHGSADMSVADVKLMAVSIISAGASVIDARHDADELQRKLQAALAQSQSMNPDADTLEREIWILWIATLEPEARILDIDPIESYLVGKGLVTKTLWYSKADEAKDIAKAKGLAADLNARRDEQGLPGGGGGGE